MIASTPHVVDWAVEEATRRNLPLHVLCAWRSDYTAETVAPLVPSMEDDSRFIVDTAAAHATTVSPGLDVSTSTVHAQAASRQADTVVVGARGVGALAEALAGSTSMQLAAYASCPVVVVKEPPSSRGRPRRVVVGVDGSDLLTEATGYAFEQAFGRGLGLTVLHAWNANVYTSGVALSELVEPRGELAAEQELITTEAITRWAEKFPTVDVRTQVMQGDRPTSWWTPRREPSSSSWPAADGAASAGCCLDPSAAASRTGPTARWPSSGPSPPTTPTTPRRPLTTETVRRSGPDPWRST